MRYLFIFMIPLIFLHGAYGATSRPMPADYTLYTYGPGEDYVEGELKNWEFDTSLDLVSAGKGAVLACEAGTYSDTCTLSGATVNSSYFRVIKAADNAGHGLDKTGGVIFSPQQNLANISVIQVIEDHAGIYDLAFKWTVNNGNSTTFGVQLWSDDCVIAGCFFHDYSNALGSAYAVGNYGEDNVIVNCLWTGGYGGIYQRAGAGINGYYLNCTGHNSESWDFHEFDGTANLINCVSQNSGSATNSTDYTSCQFRAGRVTYISAPSNLHLARTDTGSYSGTDLSSYSVFPFDDDLDGDSRRGSWYMGCDQKNGFGSAYRLPAAYTTHTFCESGCDYAPGTLANWEADTEINLVAQERGYVLLCSKGSYSLYSPLIINGATGNNDFFRVIQPAINAWNEGSPEKGVILEFSVGAENRALDVNEDYTGIYNLHIKGQSTDSTFVPLYVQGDFGRFAGLIIDDVQAPSGNIYGIYTAGNYNSTINCASVNIGNSGGPYTYSASFHDPGSHNLFYNCTAYEAQNGTTENRGFWQSGGVGSIATNNIVVQSTGVCFYGSWTKTANLEMTEATGCFYAPLSGDVRLVRNSPAIGIAENLSDDPNYAFNDDVAGTDRQTIWDAGFFQGCYLPLSTGGPFGTPGFGFWGFGSAPFGPAPY